MVANKPVAVIDYSVDGISGGRISSWLKVPFTAVRVVEGEPFPSIAAEDHRAVIHSGSSYSIIEDTSFMEEAISFVKRCSEAGVPQMGICYGHQLIARATVGIHAVARCRRIEIGWRDTLFLPLWSGAGISGEKAVWQSHYDCVVELPADSVVTATNSHTKIQAFVNHRMKLFGTQFHPEFDRVQGNECFAEDMELFTKNNIDLEAVLASGPGFNTGEVVFDHFLKTFRQE